MEVYILIVIDADVPVKTKAANIINYTKDQVSPLLTTLSELLTKKKAEAEAAYVDHLALLFSI